MYMFAFEDGVTGGAGGRRGSACSHLDPENILTLPDYSRFYAEVREGLLTVRKYAKGSPTQLHVTVDEHPGRHKQGWISHAGEWAPWVKVIYVRLSAPSRVALGGTGPPANSLCILHGPGVVSLSDVRQMTRQTTPPPTVRSPRRVIAFPFKRSAMDAKLNIDLWSTDGHEDEFKPAIPH
ncbi:BQ5605_C009g05527 [Microbotryum silenes-dioicae]|uniref:BQ5605_C009g05527 protein n=1 Tax=Microbotryum silenes-dioicae TaxID=796604 RepID=A0A2X0MD66_9BASI|nr:BQ5605_C009g05527 [Microbotryum silenes-dioicae]